MDSTAIALYEDFKKIAPRIKAASSMRKVSAADKSKTRAFLNVCELIAVGIREHAFSERCPRNTGETFCPKATAKLRSLIKQFHTAGEGTHHTYIALGKTVCEMGTRGIPAGLASRRCLDAINQMTEPPPVSSTAGGMAARFGTEGLRLLVMRCAGSLS